MTLKQPSQKQSNGIVFGGIVPHPPLLVPEVGRGQEKAIKSTSDAMAGCQMSWPGGAGLRGHNQPARRKPHGDHGLYSGKSSTGDMSAWGLRTPPRTFDNDLARSSHYGGMRSGKNPGTNNRRPRL